MSSLNSAFSGDASLTECTADAVTSGQCKVTTSGVMVSATLGNDVTAWTNAGSTTTVTADIGDGIYIGKEVQMTDLDLLPTNIANGIDIFGVTGTANLAYAACSNNALNVSACSTVASRYVTATAASNATGSDGNLTVSLPDGFSTARTAAVADTDLVASKIKAGTNLFGVMGSYQGQTSAGIGSLAPRDPGISGPYATAQSTSLQLTLSEEASNYNGADMPNSGGYKYRDIPDRNVDTDSGALGNCRYSPRPSSDCGLTQSTVAARIADCAAVNPSASTWDGATQCNNGEGLWKLVVRDTANKEVWQDQRTGLLWSSKVATATNWCKATGNTSEAGIGVTRAYNNATTSAIVGNGTISNVYGGSSQINENNNVISFTSATNFTVSGTNCSGGSVIAGGLTTTPGSSVTWSRPGFCTFTITQGTVNFVALDRFSIDSDASSTDSCVVDASTGFQTGSAVSYCAEAAGLTGPVGDTWGSGIYQASKGRMGKNSTPSVMWRTPTLNDYLIADINGIRSVMPDLGQAGSNRAIFDSSPGSGSPSQEWTATSTYSSLRFPLFYVGGSGGTWNLSGVSNAYSVRCVGR